MRKRHVKLFFLIPRSRLWLALFILLGPFNLAVWAQDANYWTEQVGNKARLLGGAVIGSVRDLSAVYYNPGALALREEREILLAGRVIEYHSYSANTPLFQGQNFGWTRVMMPPSLFAGEIRVDNSGKNRMAYSFLTRQNIYYKLRNRLEITRANTVFQNLEFVANDFDNMLHLSEYWIGATWANKITPRIGLGLTTFLAVRNHLVERQNRTQGLTESGEAAIAMATDDFDYQHWRFLWKIGLATWLEKWQVGITITTPSLGLAGSGARSYDRTIASQFVDTAGNPLNSVATNFQETSASFRSPFSLGFGASRNFSKTRIHFAAEWFAPFPGYEILDTEPFFGQTSGEPIETDVIQDLKGVFNLAFGVEYQLKDNLSLMGAFSTDFDAAEPGSRDTASVARVNIYHLSGGATFRVGSSDLTLGGRLSFGSSPYDFLGGVNPAFKDIEFSYFRASVVLGFDFLIQ